MINRYPKRATLSKKDSSSISTFAPEQPMNGHYAAPPDTAQLAHAVRTPSSVARLPWPRFCMTGHCRRRPGNTRTPVATRSRELSFFLVVLAQRGGGSTSRPHPRPTCSEEGWGFHTRFEARSQKGRRKYWIPCPKRWPGMPCYQREGLAKKEKVRMKLGDGRQRLGRGPRRRTSRDDDQVDRKKTLGGFSLSLEQRSQSFVSIFSPGSIQLC
jgi:hypothetical protein